MAVALIDVRSMYVSCERVINPALHGKPVIVVSNNDGCAISRSDEAKALGIGMGKPLFEIARDPALSQCTIRSSNYELYGDFSRRFTATVAETVQSLEVYSIDEVFATIPDTASSDVAVQTRDLVKRWTGLPTMSGIAANKTLAKLAQRTAKHTPSCDGVLDISTWPRRRINDLLDATPVGEVWGIGHRLTQSLTGVGVRSAGDLARADPGWVRRKYSVTVERIARELAGTPCIPVGAEPSTRRQLMFSRMFGHPVSTRAEMSSVLAQYAALATRRLRAHRLDAALMMVTVSSSRFRDRVWHHHVSVPLDPPTADPLVLIAAAKNILPLIEEGAPYNRAGILLTGLQPAGAQPTLFTPTDTQKNGETLARVVDQITARYGRSVVGYGPTGLRAPRRWDMRREYLSPAATTRWDQLLTVR